MLSKRQTQSLTVIRRADKRPIPFKQSSVVLGSYHTHPKLHSPSPSLCQPNSIWRLSMPPRKLTIEDAVASPLVPTPYTREIEDGSRGTRHESLLRYVRQLWCRRRHSARGADVAHRESAGLADSWRDEGYVPLTWENLCRAAYA